MAVVVAVADMFGLAGARQELVDLFARTEQEVMRQAGCRRYTFTATLAGADHFVLVSEWEDRAALEAHYASEVFARFQASLHGLLARPSEMTMYSISGAARPISSAPMDPRDAD